MAFRTRISTQNTRFKPLTSAAFAGIVLTLSACETQEQSGLNEISNDQEAAANETAPQREVTAVSPSPRYKRARGFAPSRAQSIIASEPANRERYDNGDPNPVKRVVDEPVSTFSADVDSSAYTIMRRYLEKQNQFPPASSIRVEEYINYFDYNYANPTSADKPFAPTVWVTPTPWNTNTNLMHIGVKGYDIPQADIPDANIVMLLDVSGSMGRDDKLPLVKKSIELMVGEMDADDRISIVVYAGAAGVVLEPTPGNEKSKILTALNNLQAAGSTAGGAGLSLAYKLAEENFAKDKVNRIILASDGDFNVGTVDNETLERYVAEKRKSGIFLTILGFGGQNYNDVLAQKLAQAGNGVAAYIDNLNEARKVLVTEMSSTLFTIATDLKFQVEFNPNQVAEYRLIGYETRALNEEDFNNDGVDAGDIGSGHTVTALYEIALVGSNGTLIDNRRYPDNRRDAVDISGENGELAFVKLRYKLPGSSTSDLITRPVLASERITSLDGAPQDATFAASVAAFGQKLANAPYVASMDWSQIIDMALISKGTDPFGYRSEFVQLVRAAEKTATPRADDLK